MRTCNHVWAVFTAALGMTTLIGNAESIYTPYTFTTLAGNAGYGSVDGTGRDTRFYHPSGVTVDTAGNVYVADALNHTIRKVTPAGVVTTLAGLAGSIGSVDGTGNEARFREPSGVAVDSTGSVYVADSGNHTIRKVTPAGVVTTLAGLAGERGAADATGSEARFANPRGVAVDSTGILSVADTGNQTIRKVIPAGTVTTLAGLAGNMGSADGVGGAARFYVPSGVAVDNAGNVYVADTYSSTIRKVTPAGMVTTLAGLAGVRGYADGAGSDARFNWLAGVAVDYEGTVYVGDSGGNRIRKVTAAGLVTTLAGSGAIGCRDGTATEAWFHNPSGMAVDGSGFVYVADTDNNAIRKVTPDGKVTTIAGLARGLWIGSLDGTGSAARFSAPVAVAVDGTGNAYVADTVDHTIRKVTPTGVVTTVAGLAGIVGSVDGAGSAARFYEPSGVAVDNADNVYVADSFNYTIRKMAPGGVVTTLAGAAGNQGSADGAGSTARFNNPSGVAVDGAGNLYVADQYNHLIRKVSPSGVVSTIAGMAGRSGRVDGMGNEARFAFPSGVAVDDAGNVYVADRIGTTIRRVTPAGEVTTLAGSAANFSATDGIGAAAQFAEPSNVAVDKEGNVYVTDRGSHLIRKVTPAGEVTTLAGLAYRPGSEDGKGSAARFNYPSGVAVDSDGNVYVADSWNGTLRRGYPERTVIVTTGPSFGFNAGQFVFNLIGPTGQSVVVETSNDLITWRELWTNIFAGPVHFSDPQGGAYANRFYRARLR